jgi:hypothetical protein
VLLKAHSATKSKIFHSSHFRTAFCFKHNLVAGRDLLAAIKMLLRTHQLPLGDCQWIKICEQLHEITPLESAAENKITAAATGDRVGS